MVKTETCVCQWHVASVCCVMHSIEQWKRKKRTHLSYFRSSASSLQVNWTRHWWALTKEKRKWGEDSATFKRKREGERASSSLQLTCHGLLQLTNTHTLSIVSKRMLMISIYFLLEDAICKRWREGGMKRDSCIKLKMATRYGLEWDTRIFETKSLLPSLVKVEWSLHPLPHPHLQWGWKS